MNKFIILLVSMMMVTACSSNSLSIAEKREVFESFVQSEQAPRVDKISSFDLDGWTVLSDQHLILYPGLNRYYLIKLSHTCSDLDFAMQLAVHNRGNMLFAKSDYVTVPNVVPIKCYIHSIYELNKEQRKQLMAMGKKPESQDADS